MLSLVFRGTYRIASLALASSWTIFCALGRGFGVRGPTSGYCSQLVQRMFKSGGRSENHKGRFENSDDMRPVEDDLFKAHSCSGMKLHEELRTVKEKYLSMNLDEKRSEYACGKRFVTLSKLERWPDYFAKRVKDLQSLRSGKTLYEVDGEINSKVCIWNGNIVRLEVDAIVNAANRTLLGGGGVDGAIHSAAGNFLYQECKHLTGCDTGEAKTTCGYKLPARYVIHTVGPRDRSERKLRNCYQNCFKEFHKHELKSIAFCCVSTGIYGYPCQEAARVALEETRTHLSMLKTQGRLSEVDLIIFCLFLEEDLDIYESEMQNYFPVAGGTGNPIKTLDDSPPPLSPSMLPDSNLGLGHPTKGAVNRDDESKPTELR